jgi:hypothetical protein
MAGCRERADRWLARPEVASIARRMAGVIAGKRGTVAADLVGVMQTRPNPLTAAPGPSGTRIRSTLFDYSDLTPVPRDAAGFAEFAEICSSAYC